MPRERIGLQPEATTAHASAAGTSQRPSRGLDATTSTTTVGSSPPAQSVIDEWLAEWGLHRDDVVLVASVGAGVGMVATAILELIQLLKL